MKKQFKTRLSQLTILITRNIEPVGNDIFSMNYLASA